MTEPTITQTPTEPVVAPTVVPESPPTASQEAQEAPQTLLGTELAKAPETPPTASVEAPVTVVPEVPRVEPTQEIKEEKSQSVEPAPPDPPVYTPFTLPENVKFEESRMKDFTGLLSQHKLPQEAGQKLVDFHVAEVQKAVEGVNQLYKASWDKQKNDWKESVMKDPDLGGSRFESTITDAMTFIRTHGGSSEQQKEFQKLMETSGLGNNPVMIRLLANAGRAMTEGVPLPAQKPAMTSSKSKIATLYGSLAN